VSSSISLRGLITGQVIRFDQHCQLEFGMYMQVHESHNNSMLPRTSGALALWPSGNVQGGHYFFSLNTGRVIHRARWTALPMPAEAIERIHMLAKEGGTTGVQIHDRYGHDDDGDDDNDSYQPGPDEEDEDLVYDVADEPGANEELGDPVDGIDIPQQIVEDCLPVAGAAGDPGEHQPNLVEDEADMAADESSQEDPTDIGHMSQEEDGGSEPESQASPPESIWSADTRNEESISASEDSSQQGEEDSGSPPPAVHPLQVETRARSRSPDESQSQFAAAADALAAEMD